LAAGTIASEGFVPTARCDDPVRAVPIADGIAPGRSGRPLVVDLSALWAGPLCCHLLGLAGARVVKVESSGRLDGARRGSREFYDLLNIGKDSVAVDLAVAQDRDLLARLVRRADIVVSASRPRAWAALGLDPYGVGRESPTTWVAITAYGLDQGERIGFGDDVAMTAGLVAYEPDDPMPLPCGDAIADPLTGLQAAVAALTSYQAGGSRLLDVSMHGVVRATLDGTTSTVASGRVTPPTARSLRSVGATAAAQPGRDNDRWRRE
jgi:crotonobetainyl-CoA:carnitine CoA-transferase CaiB-like acyl-CoA transferase